MKIDYHSDLKEVQSDERLARLLSAEQQSAPFDRLAWWNGLVTHCGIAPLIAVTRDDRGMAVLPLTDRLGHLQGLSNWYTFRFRPIVVGDAPLGALARDLVRRGHRLTLSGVPDEDGSASRLEAAFAAAGWLVRRSICDTNHILPIAGRDYAAYLATRPGPLRTTLKRKSNKMTTRVLTIFDENAWGDYEAIYAESWKPEEGSPKFLETFAREEAAAGRLRLGIAYSEGAYPDGHAIAAQLWTVEGGVAYIHKLAYRKDARALSPGSVLTAALMRHVIDSDHVGLVDFGTGDDPYKRDWMEAQRPRWQLDMFRPANPRNWPALARGAMHALAAPVKRS